MSKSLNRPAEGPQSGALRPQLASRVGTYIICKQEEANLRKSLPVLSKLGYPIYLFDSGSTDGTHSLIKEFDQVYLISYDYTDHCSAYNHITLTSDHEYALILDADMVPTEQLSQELKNKLELKTDSWNTLVAKIEMCVEGIPLKHASLCPPKPFLFRSGQAYFEPIGHGEKLRSEASTALLESSIRHDDNKPYNDYLTSQARYAQKFVNRAKQGHLTRRDRIRWCTPVLILAVPLFSLLVRGGYRDGLPGLIYAIDRLIAEAIMFRMALGTRLRRPSKKPLSSGD